MTNYKEYMRFICMNFDETTIWSEDIFSTIITKNNYSNSRSNNPIFRSLGIRRFEYQVNTLYTRQRKNCITWVPNFLKYIERIDK